MEARDSFCFPKKTKNPNPSPIGKKFGFCCCGVPPGTRTLGPLIKRNQRATIVNFPNHAVSLFFAFCRDFILFYPLHCLHTMFCLASVIQLFRCAKMCRAKINPLKQVSDFYAKPGNRSGSSPKWQLQSSLFRPSIKCTSTTTIHGRDLDNRTDITLI